MQPDQLPFVRELLTRPGAMDVRIAEDGACFAALGGATAVLSNRFGGYHVMLLDATTRPGPTRGCRFQSPREAEELFRLIVEAMRLAATEVE